MKSKGNWTVSLNSRGVWVIRVRVIGVLLYWDIRTEKLWRKYRILHGKCGRTVFTVRTIELLTYQKSNACGHSERLRFLIQKRVRKYRKHAFPMKYSISLTIYLVLPNFNLHCSITNLQRKKRVIYLDIWLSFCDHSFYCRFIVLIILFERDVYCNVIKSGFL